MLRSICWEYNCWCVSRDGCTMWVCSHFCLCNKSVKFKYFYNRGRNSNSQIRCPKVEQGIVYIHTHSNVCKLMCIYAECYVKDKIFILKVNLFHSKAFRDIWNKLTCMSYHTMKDIAKQLAGRLWVLKKQGRKNLIADQRTKWSSIIIF